ncbi:MAG TPA: Nif3-like dinuclear metal center hexameric protein [Chthoniobacterales bacterium]|nr:Nif3-like dinuclear metal center hexameric protein [Chthoniobacterales bacterium]
MSSLTRIVRHLDDKLRIGECGDWPQALNGLQVENSGRVRKIGAAVDASTRTFTAAAAAGVDLLIVHHGLFWAGLQTVTGSLRRQIALLLQHDIALYSAHLPLDIHPVLGNNAQLLAALGLDGAEPFLETKGQPVGLKVRATIARDELAARFEHSLGGPVQMFPHGPAETQTIGVITGGAGSEIVAVAQAGVDTFLTGEAPHWAAVAAEEWGINLLLGGHYATETFGVKALAAHVAEQFEMPWEFLAAPTGL